MITASCYGRLGQDPQARNTRTGNTMTTASIAVDVTPFGADEQVTAWVNLTAFGAVGEDLAKHAKGDCIAVIGKLTLRHWTDRDGNARESWQMTVDALHSSRTVRPGGRARRQQEPAGAAA